MTDYGVYRYTGKEIVRYGLLGMMGSYLVFYLFYRNFLLCLPLSAVGGWGFLQYEKKRRIEKNKWMLMVEFKDAMDSFVSALAAGYSMENAVSETYHNLQLMYGRETPMLRELKEMKQKLTLHQSLDLLLLDLGRRSGVEDITTFAQIYSTARKSGGNLVKVMKRTADNIGEKMEIQREIQTMIAGKKMEATCMMVIPLLIILYLLIFSPGFLDPLYQGAGGRMFMTIALLVYAAAVFWSQSIMKVPC